MRLLTLALLGLTLVATSPALAASRSAEGKRIAGPAKPAAKAAPAPKQASGAAAQKGARAGIQQAACASRQCRGGVRRASFGWTQGLAPAVGVQANECPDGTMATLARGHEDVVRCMPI